MQKKYIAYSVEGHMPVWTFKNELNFCKRYFKNRKLARGVYENKEYEIKKYRIIIVEGGDKEMKEKIVTNLNCIVCDKPSENVLCDKCVKRIKVEKKKKKIYHDKTCDCYDCRKGISLKAKD